MSLFLNIPSSIRIRSRRHRRRGFMERLPPPPEIVYVRLSYCYQWRHLGGKCPLAPPPPCRSTNRQRVKNITIGKHCIVTFEIKKNVKTKQFDKIN